MLDNQSSQVWLRKLTQHYRQTNLLVNKACSTYISIAHLQTSCAVIAVSSVTRRYCHLNLLIHFAGNMSHSLNFKMDHKIKLILPFGESALLPSNCIVPWVLEFTPQTAPKSVQSFCIACSCDTHTDHEASVTTGRILH